MLLLEARHSTDNTSSPRKFSRNDPRRLHGGTEGATTNFRTQGHEQRVARSGHAAGYDHRIWIEDVQQVCNTGTEIFRGVAYDFACDGIALLGGIIDDLRGDRL